MSIPTPAGLKTASVTYEVPDVQAMERRAKNLEGMVEVFVTIASDAEYQMAGEELTAAQGAIKKLEEQRTAITKPQNEALRAVNDLFRGPRERIEKVVDALKRAMMTYSAKITLEREVARIAADRAAAEQRQKIADEASEVERQSQVAVQSLKDQAGPDGTLTDDQVAQVRAIEEAAAAEKQALAVASEVITSTAVVRELPKAFKTAILSRDVVEVTNVVDFLSFIVAQATSRPELLEFVSFDQKRLDLAAKSFGGKLDWPGVTVHKKQSMRAGSK